MCRMVFRLLRWLIHLQKMYSLKSAETAYQNLTEDINERLEKLDIREELISTRYTEQFGAMESAMTQFNSTKTMLENFIEAWKKQK